MALWKSAPFSGWIKHLRSKVKRAQVQVNPDAACPDAGIQALPPEILEYIFLFIADVAELSALCLVSKSLYSVAIRNMYGDVKLQTAGQIQNFFGIVVKPRNAWLAALVASLSIDLKIDSTLPRSEYRHKRWLSLIRSGISSLSNLKQ
jgi:hypothetical protein